MSSWLNVYYKKTNRVSATDHAVFTCFAMLFSWEIKAWVVCLAFFIYLKKICDHFVVVPYGYSLMQNCISRPTIGYKCKDEPYWNVITLEKKNCTTLIIDPWQIPCYTLLCILVLYVVKIELTLISNFKHYLSSHYWRKRMHIQNVIKLIECLTALSVGPVILMKSYLSVVRQGLKTVQACNLGARSGLLLSD
jgi:hypothetical protein